MRSLEVDLSIKRSPAASLFHHRDRLLSLSRSLSSGFTIGKDKIPLKLQVTMMTLSYESDSEMVITYHFYYCQNYFKTCF